MVQLILMSLVVFCSFVAWRFSKKQARRIKELEKLIDEYYGNNKSSTDSNNHR